LAKRPYHSEKRREQSEKTRSAIVRSRVEAMAKGEEDVSVAELADLSGVARRTVYHYFPDKASRIKAINAWVDEQVDTSDLLPRSFDDIPAYAERLVDYILDNEVVVRAQMAPGLSKSVRSYRKRAHARHLRWALRERVSSRARIDQLVATIICTIRAEAVFDLRDLHAQTRPKIKRNLRRMVELLVEDTGAI
jgi:AcrR family transcriptional regulator